MVGLAITVASFLISFYTCKLIIQTTGKDGDYSDALRRYYGKWGWVAGLVVPIFLIFGGVTVYFVIQT
jgi:amino acid permease